MEKICIEIYLSEICILYIFKIFILRFLINVHKGYMVNAKKKVDMVHMKIIWKLSYLSNQYSPALLSNIQRRKVYRVTQQFKHTDHQGGSDVWEISKGTLISWFLAERAVFHQLVNFPVQYNCTLDKMPLLLLLAIKSTKEFVTKWKAYILWILGNMYLYSWIIDMFKIKQTIIR